MHSVSACACSQISQFRQIRKALEGLLTEANCKKLSMKSYQDSDAVSFSSFGVLTLAFHICEHAPIMYQFYLKSISCWFCGTYLNKSACFSIVAMKP